MPKLPRITSLPFFTNHYYGFDSGMVKHSQSSKYSKFAISLQYLKQKLEIKLIFVHADKHQSRFQYFGIQSFLQDDTIIIDSRHQAFSKYSK